LDDDDFAAPRSFFSVFDFLEADSDCAAEALGFAAEDFAFGAAVRDWDAEAPAFEEEAFASAFGFVPDPVAFPFAGAFDPRDLVSEESEPLTVSIAFAPAFLRASAPSEIMSPTDPMTWPASRFTPRADRFTVFATALAASVTGSVTRSSVPLVFLR